VSNVVREMAADSSGAGRDFEDRGESHLKGFPEPVRVHELRWRGSPAADDETRLDIERRLSAILSIDVVGYSRRMAEDEIATLRALLECRAVVRQLVVEHKGRVVDAPGDNLLAELGSALDAARCAAAIQRRLKTHVFDLRVGVHLGDVVVEGPRIYGDGVNVAARLEGLAEPGGICLSGSVHEQVVGKLDFPLEDLGDRELKNFPRPVRVYRASL
jgi:adenylate cyclase